MRDRFSWEEGEIELYINGKRWTLDSPKDPEEAEGDSVKENKMEEKLKNRKKSSKKTSSPTE